MQANAILIQQPDIDFHSFLKLSHKMFGYSLASTVDASPRKLSHSERFLSCLAALNDQQAPVCLSPHLLTHVSFSILIVANDRDMMDTLQYCSGMPFVIGDTVVRDIQAAVVTGTMAQWRDAVISGCQPEVEYSVRVLFNKLLGIFELAKLNVWKDCERTQAQDNTILIEDLR